ncbi:GNAT family N-acetyltransferase [Micromonospora sp. S-DT3-3-22]|uniref:GNAT family N-acetyltransferase n=1 Tax=Micromonospora sp. S-DT3-3-22 TaxID=2755359 RepID=UPI00188F8C02|nr:GNAT family N-acetyltransferase [Micromonospora sp. S-DT3-3-22]
MVEFEVRERVEADEAALAALSEQVADGGRVAFTIRDHVPAADVRRARHPDSVGVIAEADGRLVGSGWVRFDRARIGGQVVQVGFLHGLAVHPDYRRQGVARAMTDFRLRRVEARGPGVVAVATIQRGNAGSMANAAWWASRVTGDLRVTPVPMRRTRPGGGGGWTVRAAVRDDLDTIVAELERRYRDFGVAPVTGREELTAWLETAVGDITEVNSYVVVTDRQGRLLAGLGVIDEARLSEMRIRAMPYAMRLAGRALGVVGAGGIMRNLSVTWAWHRPDSVAAGRFLWQTVRWRMRGRGTALVTTVDVRDPIRAMISAPGWLPSTSIALVIRSSSPWDDARLLAVPS